MGILHPGRAGGLGKRPFGKRQSLRCPAIVGKHQGKPRHSVMGGEAALECLVQVFAGLVQPSLLGQEDCRVEIGVR